MSRAQSTPLNLFLQKNDGTIVTATEQDFYQYTTKRWLANDKLESLERYREFNIRELLHAAIQSSSTGASKCTHVMKHREGQYNKAFLLEFNDGREVVAKLPNPNAGPKRLTTASEVATMDYAREKIGLPIPRVLSWNSDSSNPVGSEYIIMEKAKGIALGDIWYQLPTPSKYNFIRQVVDMEAKLASFVFPETGCIYYTRDLPLEDKPKRKEQRLPLHGDDAGGFCIGPVVDPGLWLDGRDRLADLYRGPWRQISQYARDIGTNEKEWATRYAQPRMNYYRSNTDCDTPNEYIDLIQKYLLLAPYLTQSKPDDTTAAANLLTPTLWHDDLHLNNIYVDPQSETITDIIDWQSTKIAPLILQARIPRMVRHATPLPLGWSTMPEKPDDYESLSERDRVKADRVYDSALCHKYYEVQTAKRNPRLYAAISHHHQNDGRELPLVQPMKSITGAWAAREVFKLRSTLIDVVDHWQELQQCPDDCPITFTEEERKLHNEEMENREYIEQLMEEFQNAGILPVDGIVDPDDYEIVQETNRKQKEMFLSLAENPEQREWMDKIWPYQDYPEGA